MTVYNLADHPKFKPEQNLITRSQLMKLWSIKSPNTIKKYVRMGMPEVRLPGGSPRYNPQDCYRWLQSDR